METIMVIKDWIVDNGSNIAKIIAYIISAATIIVKLTPSQKDDTVLKKIVDFVGKYIALNK